MSAMQPSNVTAHVPHMTMKVAAGTPATTTLPTAPASSTTLSASDGDAGIRDFSRLLGDSYQSTFSLYKAPETQRPAQNWEAFDSKLKMKLGSEYFMYYSPAQPQKEKNSLDSTVVDGGEYDKYGTKSIPLSKRVDQLLGESSKRGHFSSTIAGAPAAGKASSSSFMRESITADEVGIGIGGTLMGWKDRNTDKGPVKARSKEVYTDEDALANFNSDLSTGREYNNQELSNLKLSWSALAVNEPSWHPPWVLQRVISGHQGWVQCLAVDPTNDWFASGGNDRLIKIWDLATGVLKLSLTGHINTVKDLVVSDRHPYLFSCGEDNRVKCWDLEQNKVVRDFHGHLSGVYSLTLHPRLDILASGGRDAVVRVWDIRTRAAVHVLSGHSGTIMSLSSQALEPQIISGSQDKMVRLWDLAAGKCMSVLTHHKKSIRAIEIHPQEYSFCTAAADGIKIWRCPEGSLSRSLEGYNAIANCCAIKGDEESSMLVVGTNNGQLNFWDWKSGYKFQTIQSRVQPGSLESENGIFACVFDRSETKLITGECDQTIKIWKEEESATPETHPIVWRPNKFSKKQ